MTHPLTPRENLTRPVVGIENRTAQEVFDIMSDRFRAHLTALASGSGDHAELARLAEAATPGPWSAADWDDYFGENRFTVQATEPEVLSPGQSSIWPDGIRCLRVAETRDGERPAEDAAFIAAANPATVLALIAENAALRESISRHDRQVSGMLRARLAAENRATEAERKLAEAVGLLKRIDRTYADMQDGNGNHPTELRKVRAFLNKVAERG